MFTTKTRAWVVAPLVALTLLIAPTAYSIQTASTAHSGALPTAGPASAGGFGGARGGPGGQGMRGATGGGPVGTTNGGTTNGGTTNGGTTNGGTTNGGFPGRGQTNGGFPGGGQTNGGFPGGGNSTQNGGPANGGGFPGGTQPGGAGRGAGAGGGGRGGLGGASSVSSALSSALKSDAGNYTWVAATTGDNEAASLELATGESVMALGGYNGTDPAITLTQFKALVAAGKVHYYVADGQGFIGSTSASTSTAYAIQKWVTSTFSAETVGGSTVYDLTS